MTVRLHGTNRACSVAHLRAWFADRRWKFTPDPPKLGQLMSPLQARVAHLQSISTDLLITVDQDFYPTSCEHCDLGTETSVRVYGRPPRDTVHNPVVLEVCCFRCAISAFGPVERALDERAHPTQTIQIEVCPE